MCEIMQVARCKPMMSFVRPSQMRVADLLLSACKGHKECMKNIMRIAVNCPSCIDSVANTADNFNRTALHFAIRYRVVQAFTLLLQCKSLKKDAADNAGRTALFWCVKCHDMDMFKALLDFPDVFKALSFPDDKFNVNSCDRNGFSILHHAVCFSDDVVQLLLTSKNINVNAQDRRGCSPLHMSIHNSFTCTHALLSHADIDVNAFDTDVGTPLHWAVLGEDRVFSLLLSHDSIDVNAKDPHGYTPLLFSVDESNSYAVEKLLACPSVKVNEVCDIRPVNVNEEVNGVTALHLALVRGSLGIVKALLTHSNTDVNAQNSHGSTPLHLAIKILPDLGVIKEILNAPNLCVNLKDKEGKTAFHSAIYKLCTTKAAMLLDYPGLDVATVDADGMTPLQHATEAYMKAKDPSLDYNLREDYNKMGVLILKIRSKVMLRMWKRHYHASSIALYWFVEAAKRSHAPPDEHGSAGSAYRATETHFHGVQAKKQRLCGPSTSQNA